MQGGGPFKDAVAGAGDAACRATSASRCRKNSPRWATTDDDFAAHIDFKLRDIVRAEQKKHGMVTDGHPTAALLDKMGVNDAVAPRR